nr:hypothetical protein [Tanacetum cinerariifolium]
MNNKKHIVNLEYFREMLHICPRLLNQTFDKLPFEEEILAFLRYLGHSGEIRKLTDVNINKLHQPWRSFVAVINKCLSGKSTGYDSLRLSQAHILWEMYHKKNVDFAYLLWEDFVYQVEHKDAKKSNEMYYPRTHNSLVPCSLLSTNEDIRNYAAYKEYYAIASGAAPPKTKVSARKTLSSSDTTITPPTAACTRLSTSAKGKQPAKSSKAKDQTSLPRNRLFQLVYDVLRLTPFYKAFLVTTDVSEIYMQEFWATATVHHHSICFKMNNKKHIVNLKYFREMLHICPRLLNQTFDELPFEEEILAFLRYLGHSGEIRKLTDVNINKLHQPWRSFVAVINKCLSGKSTGYDSLRLSEAQILWGMYHKKNVDFAYLLWEDFVYQVEHKDAKKRNEMYYPRTHNSLVPCSLLSTNEDIRNYAAYKEYYAIASGAAPPKTKASARKTLSSSDTTITPPMAACTRLSTSAKGKQPAKSSKVKGLYVLFEVAMTEAEQMKLATKRSLQQTHISQASGSGADEGT